MSANDCKVVAVGGSFAFWLLSWVGAIGSGVVVSVVSMGNARSCLMKLDAIGLGY
jgi:hypothetical protein